MVGEGWRGEWGIGAVGGWLLSLKGGQDDGVSEANHKENGTRMGKTWWISLQLVMRRRRRRRMAQTA